MEITKAERETGLIDLSETPDDQKVILKLLPGFVFHHPNGTKLKRDFENTKLRETPVIQYDAAGGATRVPHDSPFIAVPVKAVRGQEVKFARPSMEELEMLSKKGQQNLSPPAAAEHMVTLGVENKQLGAVPDKELKASETPSAQAEELKAAAERLTEDREAFEAEKRDFEDAKLRETQSEFEISVGDTDALDLDKDGEPAKDENKGDDEEPKKTDDE